MKTHILKRLSALTAGFAVALAGSLAAMPAAHAASTYTLDQVGGTAQVTSFTFQGQQIKGHYGGSSITQGTYVLPEYASRQYYMGTKLEVPLSRLNGGDTVTIPLTAPERGKVVFYAKYSCASEDLYIGDVKVARKSISGDTYNGYSLVLSFYDGVSGFDKLEVETSLETTFWGDYNNVKPEDIEYDESKLFVGIGSHKFFYEKTPYQGGFGNTAYPIEWTWGSQLLSHNQRPEGLRVEGQLRAAGLGNYVLKGDYNNKSPQVNANWYQVTRINTLSGATVDSTNITFILNTAMAETGDYFSYHAQGGTSRISMFTQKTLAQDALLADFNAVDGLLAPGEYAIINNTDGTIDLAVNYGPFYNNPRNKFPDGYVYTITDYPAGMANVDELIAQGQANVDTLSAGGYGALGVSSSVVVHLNNAQYSQAVTSTTWTKIYDQVRQRTDTGYWDVGAGTSTGGTVAQSFIAYDANGGSGAVPGNTVGNVGSSVSVANQGALARTGYTFNGWNTKADGTGTSYKAGDSYTLTRDGLKLFAQWKANNYSVTFNGNGSTGGSTAALTGKPYGSKVTLTANGFVRTGYSFKGWNTKADGTGTAYADRAQFTIPAGNTTLYAQWLSDDVVPGDQPKPAGYVTVTFAKGTNGKSLTGQASYHVDPSKNVTLVPPTAVPNTGFAFSKWDKSYTNVKFTGDTTITAQYTAVNDVVSGDQPQPEGYVKVTFNKGASGSLSGETSFWVNPSKTVTLTAPTVKPNTGYVFDKWDTNFTNVKFAGATTITALYKVEELVEIYRMYDGVEHLYVNNATERDALVGRGWKYEGVAFSTPKTSSTAVHRLFQPGTGDHHYTSDATEIATLTGKHGWKDEGVLFYGDDAKRVELKRLFMAGLGKGEHLHTADPNELEALTTKHGWKEEGISFYVAKYGS